jgi:protein-tyrosine phosphatase
LSERANPASREPVDRGEERREPVRLLFVCLGNICRSPTAEGVMRHVIEEAGMTGEVELDSAGTGSWHVGSAPDERATAAARGRGVTLAGEARQVRPADFEDFDLVLAMDRANLRDLVALAGGDAGGRIRLLREFDPGVGGPSSSGGDLDVPDPYYGASGGFEEVFDLVDAACRGLLEEIRAGRLP